MIRWYPRRPIFRWEDVKPSLATFLAGVLILSAFVFQVVETVMFQVWGLVVG